MAFAQGASSGLAYLVESTFNTVPSTPSLIDLPINTHTLGLAKSALESEENRSDRQVAVYRHGNKRISGDIPVDFRADDYDDLLESLFLSAFSTNVMSVGDTLKYLTFEDRATDINQYRVFSGCAVNSFNLTIRPDEIVKASFGIIGASAAAISGSSIDATPTAASGNEPFDSFTATIEDNSTELAIVTSLELRVENGLNQAFAVGSDEAQQIEYGRCRVSGTLNAYYQDATLLNKFINETESDLSIALTDGTSGNTYTFELPRIKYNGGDVPLQNEQSRIIQLPFVGLYDSVTGTSLKVTKS